MSVYAIAQLWIHDPHTYGRYDQGRVLVADESPVVLGRAWDADKVVVFSFPDEPSFRMWAESPEYLEIAKDRTAAAKSVIALVEGIASPGDAPKS